MRVVTIDAPGRKYAFRESIFARPADVIHDFVFAIFDDSFANSRSKIVEHFVPTHALPISCTALAASLQGIKNAIGVGNLIERGRTFGAVAPAAARILWIAFELLNLVRVFVDIGK